MGLREILNRNPRTTAAVAVAGTIILLLAVVVWFGRNTADAGGRRTSSDPKAWYTIDDGRTWFSGAANQIVPFDYQGKRAYRCHVWTCDGGRTEFVSHLERLTETARRQLAGKTQFDPLELVPRSLEVKPPLTGEGQWVPMESPQGERIRTPRCPDGKHDNLQFVEAK